MTTKELKNHLCNLNTISFILPNGEAIPNHFHVTEVGKTTKNFIDCGGTLRQEQKVNFQLWHANDYDHRLHPEKLLQIVSLAEDTFNIENLDIEIEFQGNQSIEKFNLEFKDNSFLLTSQLTNCLALDQCGIPPKKEKKALSSLQNQSCTPNSGCC